MPPHATTLNGYHVKDACFFDRADNHVFLIGDWGGVVKNPWSSDPDEKRPRPADHRSPKFADAQRPFVVGVDDWAQQKVRDAMEARAAHVRPDYILNAGDNFYWGGVDVHCGSPVADHHSTGQWQAVFEWVYNGPALQPLQWLGVLGNHDYGGWMFTGGWDQTIGYTWHSPGDRWIQPAQYWKTKVWYSGFEVDYFFLDTNVFTIWKSGQDNHNICSRAHNPSDASCGAQGPGSVDECPGWFSSLWRDQLHWLMEHLDASTATWQVIVTHLPPDLGKEQWKWLSRRYGIDLILTGHIHLMRVYGPESAGNFLAPTAWVISGGGGGITSSGIPRSDGHDDQYGFVDLTFTREEITIETVSHAGLTRHTSWVRQRMPDRVAAKDNPWPFTFAEPASNLHLRRATVEQGYYGISQFV